MDVIFLELFARTLFSQHYLAPGLKLCEKSLGIQNITNRIWQISSGEFADRL